ncbi:MAG: hypothetical protein ABIL09_15610, partial [Gemmatimonadota bacterium]
MPAARSAPFRGFDIAPFALPNTPPGEIRFEEPRDVERVEVLFTGAAPARIGLQYWRRSWPGERHELRSDLDNPCRFGWIPMDDWFNGEWQDAAVQVARPGRGKAVLTFAGLARELTGVGEYDVTFRRTLGLRLALPAGREPRAMRVFTRSPAATARLRVELDAGRRTPGRAIRLSGYNLEVQQVTAGAGVRVDGNTVRPGAAKRRRVAAPGRHMVPPHRCAGDGGQRNFDLG